MDYWTFTEVFSKFMINCKVRILNLIGSIYNESIYLLSIHFPEIFQHKLILDDVELLNLITTWKELLYS